MRIARYIQPISPVAPDTVGAVVFERFQAEPNLMVIPVTDADDRPLGLIERNAFMLKMAAAFGRELYAGRPVSGLMNARPVIAEADASADALFGASDEADASALMGGFIAVRNGRYCGAGSTLEILQAASAAHRDRAEQMARLAQDLAAAEAEARASSRARSEFLAVMSHEIRTPLNGVLGVARVLERKLTQEDLRPYVTAMVGSGESLLGLLTDALDMSRAEAGVAQLDIQPLDLSALASDVEALWRARAEEKGLRLILKTDMAQAAWVMGDRVRLKQLLNNLVGNALKFTDRGQVVIELNARPEGDRIAIVGAVEDTGPGIPEGTAARIFEPFNTGEAGRTGAGAGLGLTICRQIVEAMQGRIAVQAARDGGARFIFGMTLDRAEEQARSGAAPEPTPHETLHVLVVDDNATNRFVATKVLEMFGCTSDVAEDGPSAIEAARQGRHDLILMDIQMPGMDGVATTGRIRALGGTAGATPVIALTANAAEADARRYHAAGMAAVVCKPLDPAALLDAIRRVLAVPGSAAAA
ncbi:ATP-binding protein [Brevundimonas sp. VNH65]|uniref:ATP-binding protein n=1 Tax=Brevundimonas sp. VNH65 TaxID=3400917 RepID=UPI003C09EFF4